MRAGLLRNLVTLQRPDTTENGGFSDVTQTKARIETFAATSEPLVYGQPQALAQVRITCRYRADVDATWRVRVDERTFQIAGYGDPDGRRRELLLVCSEIQ